MLLMLYKTEWWFFVLEPVTRQSNCRAHTAPSPDPPECHISCHSQPADSELFHMFTNLFTYPFTYLYPFLNTLSLKVYFCARKGVILSLILLHILAFSHLLFVESHSLNASNSVTKCSPVAYRFAKRVPFTTVTAPITSRWK